MYAKQQKQIYLTQSEEFKMTTIELLEESLKQLKIIQLDNLRREPNHPRNKFDYTVIVPDHPLGYHEHYTMDLEVAKKSAIEWARDYGRASVAVSYTHLRAHET